MEPCCRVSWHSAAMLYVNVWGSVLQSVIRRCAVGVRYDDLRCGIFFVRLVWHFRFLNGFPNGSPPSSLVAQHAGATMTIVLCAQHSAHSTAGRVFFWGELFGVCMMAGSHTSLVWGTPLAGCKQQYLCIGGIQYGTAVTHTNTLCMQLELCSLLRAAHASFAGNGSQCHARVQKFLQARSEAVA